MTYKYPRKYKISIIGGGPNGLALLADLRKNFSDFFDIRLYERSSIADNILNLPNTKWHSSMSELYLDNFNISKNNIFAKHYQPKSSELANFYKLSSNEFKDYIFTNHELVDVADNPKEKLNNFTLKFNVLDKDISIDIQSDFVILATGNISNPKKFKIPNYGYANSYLDINIKNKKVLIIGSGASSVDSIINLLPHNIIHWVRRGEIHDIFPTLRKNYEEKIRKFKTNLFEYKNSEVINYSNSKKYFITNKHKIINANHVIALIGYISKTKLTKQIKLKHESDFISYDPKTLMTSRENIYLFGSNLTQKTLSINVAKYIHNGNRIERKKIISDILFKTNPELNNLIEKDFEINKIEYSIKSRIKNKIKGIISKLI